MNFIKNYSVDLLIPSSYNPRRVTSPNFKLLKESIKKLGVVKPIIVNGENNILTAGHHRIKALKELKIDTCPVLVLPSIIKQDEILFNLLHNSIECQSNKLSIEGNLPFGFSIVDPQAIKFSERAKNAAVVTTVGKLLMRYGEWGSIVVDEKGNCIANSDYAVATKQLGYKLLVYKLHNKDLEIFNYYINQDYGEYFYEALNIKPYNQTYTQPHRMAENSDRKFESILYKEHVIPNLSKDDRLLDFGAGEAVHVAKLRSEGYKAFAYEPYLRFKSTSKFNIKAIVGQIKEIYFDVKKSGLYDKVVLDSVINSVSDLEFERCVLLACNALMQDDGVFYTQTRCTQLINNHLNLKQARSSNRRLLEFLNKDGFSATFRQGVWTLQKFHSKESLTALLENYFEDVRVFDEKKTYIKAICQKPIRFTREEYHECLTKEFNMEYPNKYKHDKHTPLVQIVLANVAPLTYNVS